MILLTVGELQNLTQKINPSVNKNTAIRIEADNKKACIKSLQDNQVLAWDRRRASVNNKPKL